MSIPLFPAVSDGRLIDLQTGELSSGDVAALLDRVFAAPAPALRQRTAERFSEAGGTQSASGAEPGLYSVPYWADGGKSVSLTVYADVVQVQVVGAAERRTADYEARRGVCVGFGKRPRRRMMEALAKIRNVVGGHFLTLTFPDAVWQYFSADDQGGMAHYAKEKLHALEKRLTARFPAVGGIWRLEFQDRKSGALLGTFVPHFHILAFGIEGAHLALLQRWLSDVWFDVVGSGDEKHLRAGTNCRELSSRRHAAAYVSKYVGKEESDEYAAGRRWGTFGLLDQSGSLTVDLSIDQLVQFKRLVRRWLRSRKSRFAVVMRRLPAAVGATMLGLGDESCRGSPGGFDPTVIRMLAAIGVEVTG